MPTPLPVNDNYHDREDNLNALQKELHHNQIPLTIVNGTSSIGTYMKTAVNNSNNLFLANKITPEVTEAETDRNHWLTTHDGFSIDK